MSGVRIPSNSPSSRWDCLPSMGERQTEGFSCSVLPSGALDLLGSFANRWTWQILGLLLLTPSVPSHFLPGPSPCSCPSSPVPPEECQGWGKTAPWPCSHMTRSQKKLSRKDAELRPGLILLEFRLRLLVIGRQGTGLSLPLQSLALGCPESWHLLLCYPCAVGNLKPGGCQWEATSYSLELCLPCCLWKQLSVGTWLDAFHEEWLSSGLWLGLCGGGCWTEWGPGGREGGPATVADGIRPRADSKCLLQYAFLLLISSWAELIN